jgi:hypothetical protein
MRLTLAIAESSLAVFGGKMQPSQASKREIALSMTKLAEML